MGLSYSEVGVAEPDQPPAHAPTMSLHELREEGYSVNRGTERGWGSAEHRDRAPPSPSPATARAPSVEREREHDHRRPRALDLMARTIDPTGAVPPTLLTILVCNTMLMVLCAVLLIVKKN